MSIAFAINNSNKKLIPTIISIYTFSKYYHCELVFSDNKTLCCSVKGLQWLNRDYTKNNWEVLPLNKISGVQEYQIREEAADIFLNYKGYDWIAAVLGRLNYRINDTNRWFCSELCAHLLEPYYDAITRTRWWSPDALYKAIKNKK